MDKQRVLRAPLLVVLGLLTFLAVPAAAQAHHYNVKATCDLENNAPVVNYTVTYLAWSDAAKPTTKGTVTVNGAVSKTVNPNDGQITWVGSTGTLKGKAPGVANATASVVADFQWIVNGKTEHPAAQKATTGKCPVPVPKPGIDVEKVADSATAVNGTQISYTITAKNTGDTAYVPQVTDSRCTLTRIGGNASDTTFDPGDTWTYTCVVTTSADVNVKVDENCVSATGTVPGVPPVSDEDCAETPLTPPPPVTPPVNPPVNPPTPVTPSNPETPGGGVLPEEIASGLARLRGPSGCVKTAFNARVSGRSISSVTFFVDGKRVKRISGQRASYKIKVKPNRYGFGRHRVVARVEFVEGAGTSARRLPLTFRRCAQGAVAPRFTG